MDSDDMEHIFNGQLTNCGVDFFDYYILHNMGSNVYEKCLKYGAFDFAQKKKAEDKIKVFGIYFH
jgi:predicted aldo/keto reductase-like oxidoreductase